MKTPELAQLIKDTTLATATGRLNNFLEHNAFEIHRNTEGIVTRLGISSPTDREVKLFIDLADETILFREYASDHSGKQIEELTLERNKQIFRESMSKLLSGETKHPETDFRPLKNIYEMKVIEKIEKLTTPEHIKQEIKHLGFEDIIQNKNAIPFRGNVFSFECYDPAHNEITFGNKEKNMRISATEGEDGEIASFFSKKGEDVPGATYISRKEYISKEGKILELEAQRDALKGDNPGMRGKEIKPRAPKPRIKL